MRDPSLALADPLLQRALPLNGRCSQKVFIFTSVLLGLTVGLLVLLKSALCTQGQSEQQLIMPKNAMIMASRSAPSPSFSQLRQLASPWKSMQLSRAWQSMRPARPWHFMQVARGSAEPGMSAMPGTQEDVSELGPLYARLDVDVAIAGGGLGGLATCAALRARGINAHVFEAEPQLLRGSTGTGIMISANGWKALEAIDPAIPTLMRSLGARITNQTIYMTDKDGTVKRTFSMNATTFKEKYGAEQYNVGWARAHEVIASQVPDHAVHTGYKLSSYSFGEDDESLDISFDNGHRVRAALLVGADGVGSVVRRLVAGDAACETRYNGQLLWNAIIDSKSVPHAHGDGGVEFVMTGVDGQAILAFDAGENKTSWYLTMMEKDAPPNISAALASGAFGGFGHGERIAELEKVFKPWPVAVDLLHATPESQIFERRLADRAALFDWADTSTKGGGRVVLLGDAAHPMIPSQGQGTMVTWEDAADLAALLELKSKANGVTFFRQGVPAAVSDFVSRRAERCAMVQEHSAESYMGKPVPSTPRMMWRMLKMKAGQLLGIQSMTDKMYGGYTPLKISDDDWDRDWDAAPDSDWDANLTNQAESKQIKLPA